MSKAPSPGRSTPPIRGKNVPATRRSPLPIILGVVGLIVLAGIAYLVFSSSTGTSSAGRNEREVPVVVAEPTKGPNHVDPKPVTYNSNPPTGGDHWGQTATWGIQLSAPKDESLVHNLEHGGVIIWYNPDKVDSATVEKMRTLTRDLQKSNPRVVLTPRASIENDKPLAVTSWGWLMTLDGYDEAAIRDFYRRHIGQGPECQNGQCPL